MDAKWIFDRTASFLGLICLCPILLIIAILIKIKMPGGPVIFQQVRVGKEGKLFTMYKFRSMQVIHSGSSISIAGESRITPLGAVLRKYKLDELPELWNVLIGDMSFVGPRPDVPGYADQLTGENKLILKLRPGITGPASLKYANEEELLAQVPDPVKYNNEIIFPDKVQINLDYYYTHTFRGDLKLIFQTIFHVGPRPDVPGYADQLTGENKLILKLRPGITGPASLKYANEEELLAQVPDPVKYNNEIIFPDKVQINLDYYYTHTFRGDLKLIFQTIFHTYPTPEIQK